jgi:hypothetical protein
MGRRKKKRSSNPGSSLQVSSNKPTGSTTSFPASDLKFRRQNFNLVQSPPRQLSNQIYWSRFKNDTTLNSSNISVTETNFLFTGGQFVGGSSNLFACFDQYCIHSVIATFTSNANVTTPIRLWTAIDYDSVANVGKVGIQAFGSCAFHSLAGDGSTSGERLIYPCIAPQVTSSNLPVPAGVGRMWLDSGYPSVAHYGLRTIVDEWVNVATQTVEVTFTAIMGFRNSI